MEPLDYAKEIVKKLQAAGYIAYFAGGWVRDFLMKHPSSDIDIATDAPPKKVLDLFPQTVLVGLSFGVVIVNMCGHQFEVATFRKDFGYSDGRKPDRIEFTDARGDALRRDFTINGMFYDPFQHVIHDFVSGAADLQAGIIRAIGNPYERFLEDRLRMIRAVRFASRFAFAIDTETCEAIVANADTLFPAVAKERVWMEFCKMAQGPRFDHALVELHRLGLLQVIFPRLQGMHLNEVKHRTAAFQAFPSGTPTSLYLCELFFEASLEEQLEIFRALHVSNQELKWVEARFLAAHFLHPKQPIELAQWAHFYAKAHSPLLIELEAAKLKGKLKEAFLEQHNLRQCELSFHIAKIKEKKPVLNASVLKQEGILPGREMGRLLQEAERFSINCDVRDQQAVLEHLKASGMWQQTEFL